MKAGSQLDQRSYLTRNPNFSRGGTIDTRNNFENRALSRTVATDDGNRFALVDHERNSLQSFEIMVTGPFAEQMCKCLAQGIGALLNQTETLHDVSETNALGACDAPEIRHKKPMNLRHAGRADIR